MYILIIVRSDYRIFNATVIYCESFHLKNKSLRHKNEQVGNLLLSLMNFYFCLSRNWNNLHLYYQLSMPLFKPLSR